MLPFPSNRYNAKPVYETVSNGFFTVDNTWKVLYWNKAAEKLSGIASANISGMNLLGYMNELIPLQLELIFAKAFSPDQPAYFEEYCGTMGEWSDVIIYHCGKTLSVSFKVAKQVSNFSGSQQQSLNELYKYVTEITNDCLWEWNLQAATIFWVDGGHKRVFGYPVENALIPQSFWEQRIHPDDQRAMVSNIDYAKSHPGIIWEAEYRFKKSCGEYAWVHDRGHIIFEDGEPARIIGATQDITTRRKTEMQLLESERKLSLIARETVNAVIITDAAEKIMWVNSAFTRITEYAAEEVIGRRPGSFLQGRETDPSTVEYLRRQMATKLPFDCNMVNYTKTGRKYWVHIQGQPLADENGVFNRFFAIETDITGKLEMEDTLHQVRMMKHKEMTDAVLTAQENERSELGKELHDNLNQILGATKLYIEMAKSDSEERQNYLDKASSYVVTVIAEIRRISKSLLPTGMGLIGLFDSIVILVEDLTIIHSLNIGFDSHHIDQQLLNEKLQMNIFRIVQEQCNNIIKHAGATIATIDINKMGSDIVLTVTDNGIGTDIGIASQGIGLRSIMSRAASCHGRAEFDSRPGQGFQLKVVMPLS